MRTGRPTIFARKTEPVQGAISLQAHLRFEAARRIVALTYEGAIGRPIAVSDGDVLEYLLMGKQALVKAVRALKRESK